MGYTTDFEGQFNLDRPLQPEHAAYLQKFATTRRMVRDADVTSQLKDPVREAAGLPIGEHAEFFVGGDGFMGQDRDESIVNHNHPPPSQPGLWCQWVPNEEGTAIEWDGAEKFYDYVEWLRYLVTKFLAPWGYVLNGEVRWRGEDFNDVGTIIVKNNDVTSVDRWLK